MPPPAHTPEARIPRGARRLAESAPREWRDPRPRQGGRGHHGLDLPTGIARASPHLWQKRPQGHRLVREIHGFPRQRPALEPERDLFGAIHEIPQRGTPAPRKSVANRSESRQRSSLASSGRPFRRSPSISAARTRPRYRLRACGPTAAPGSRPRIPVPSAVQGQLAVAPGMKPTPSRKGKTMISARIRIAIVALPTKSPRIHESNVSRRRRLRLEPIRAAGDICPPGRAASPGVRFSYRAAPPSRGPPFTRDGGSRPAG